MIAALTDHLWQSTVFACAAWLVATAPRRNRAAIRYAAARSPPSTAARIWFDLPRVPAPGDDQIREAVRKLGLALEPTKAQGEYIVIDRVERPTPNAPNPGGQLPG